MESSSHTVFSRASPLIQDLNGSIGPNGSSGPKPLLIDLKRVIIEGYTQSFQQRATLTLKNGDSPFGSSPAQTSTTASAVTYRHFMQIHIDGKTLAAWDLSLLTERDITERGVFYSQAEEKMLRLTLPLTETATEKQPGKLFKAIQLHIDTHQDFHTAISYLSRNVGLRHLKLTPRVTGLRAQSPYHSMPSPMPYHTQSPSGTPTMPPPMHPAREDSSQRMHTPRGDAPFARQQTQRTLQFDARTASGHPRYKAWIATPDLATVRQQSSSYSPRDLLFRESSSQRTHILDQSHVEAEAGSWGPTQPYDQAFQSPRPSFQTQERATSRGVGQSSHEPDPSQDQVNGDELGDHPPNHISNLQMAPVPTGRHSSSTLRNSSAEIYSYEQPYPSVSVRERLARGESRPRSRPGSASALRVPFNIQFIGPSSRNEYPYCSPITLKLPPSTKAWTLCLHAANHVNQEFGMSVDHTTLEARDENGHVLAGHVEILKAIAQDSTICLIECLQATVQQPHKVPSPDPSYPPWTSSSGLNPHEQAHPLIDRGDQMPPPRKLPFTPGLKSGTETSPAQTTAPDPSPLAEGPGLIDRSSLKAVQEGSTPPSTNDNTKKAAGKKRPASRQSASRQSCRRPISRLSNLQASADMSELGESATSIAISERITRSAAAQMNGIYEAGDRKQAGVMPAATQAKPAGQNARIEFLAQSSCMSCRNKKLRCDRAMPECGRCEQAGRKCTYPPTRPESAIVDSRVQPHSNETMDSSMTSGYQGTGSAPVMRDIATQASATPDMQDATIQVSVGTQDIAVQAEEAKGASEDVEMKDSTTNTLTTYIDAAVKTTKCDDIWFPLSQSLTLVSWARDRHGEQLKKAEDVFRTTDPSRGDHRDKVYLAAQYGLEFELELGEMCEKVLRDSC